MYTYNQIKRLHLEISSLCQASCPMCARNNHGGLENPNLIEKNLDLEFFKKAVPVEFLEQLKSISMCGNFGDPILNNDLIEFVQYISTINPAIDLHIHTNGSARTTKWWEDLFDAMPARHLVLFGIDGFEDTHSLYRIGTDFNKIIKNAKAFIDKGGKARWNFITFKHNEHQLADAAKMASDLGFESFHEKQTSRFIGSKEFNVFDKAGNVTHTLMPPGEQKIAFIDRKTVENYREVVKTAKISCEVEEQKSIYLDAQGHIWPCCFLASVPYQYATPDKLVFNFMNDSTTSLMKALEAFGGISGLDLRKRTIQEIVDSNEWQTVWNEGFKTNSILMCARVCGKFPEVEVSQCRDQFLELKEFNE
jgi:MoaA/NifB/PqqE/SkfB family radical SAM enzyme